MRSTWKGFIALAVLVSFAGQAQAGDWEKFWSKFHLVKQRNEAWPQPFMHQDQISYRSTFAPMVDAGWQVECTLNEVHFDPNSHELNKAGEARIASILSTIPRDRQQLFIVQSKLPEVNEKRVASVQQQMAAWSITQAELPIGSTLLAPYAAPGNAKEAYQTRFSKSLPIPSLNSVSDDSVE
jgi:hypothetical protein